MMKQQQQSIDAFAIAEIILWQTIMTCVCYIVFPPSCGPCEFDSSSQTLPRVIKQFLAMASLFAWRQPNLLYTLVFHSCPLTPSLQLSLRMADIRTVIRSVVCVCEPNQVHLRSSRSLVLLGSLVGVSW